MSLSHSQCHWRIFRCHCHIFNAIVTSSESLSHLLMSLSHSQCHWHIFRCHCHILNVIVTSSEASPESLCNGTPTPCHTTQGDKFSPEGHCVDVSLFLNENIKLIIFFFSFKPGLTGLTIWLYCLFSLKRSWMNNLKQCTASSPSLKLWWNHVNHSTTGSSWFNYSPWLWLSTKLSSSLARNFSTGRKPSFKP